jgi:hypothetical protein
LDQPFAMSSQASRSSGVLAEAAIACAFIALHDNEQPALMEWHLEIQAPGAAFPLTPHACNN